MIVIQVSQVFGQARLTNRKALKYESGFDGQ